MPRPQKVCNNNQWPRVASPAGDRVGFLDLILQMMSNTGERPTKLLMMPMIASVESFMLGGRRGFGNGTTRKAANMRRIIHRYSRDKIDPEAEKHFLVHLILTSALLVPVWDTLYKDTPQRLTTTRNAKPTEVVRLNPKQLSPSKSLSTPNWPSDNEHFAVCSRILPLSSSAPDITSNDYTNDA
ncbi:hypothetical protein K440DRAFT_642073 [Wilcoxina mikolae CBS 423.85]|nr:hypothetical protein K440DRAFT_642073 [Wilcoxina mikolae CBS 423.85]